MTLQYPLPMGLPDTPERAFAALCQARSPFWLDSGDEPSAHGRYHFLGCCPSAWYRARDEDPFDGARSFIAESCMGPETPEPSARIVGYFAYDLGRFVERVPPAGPPSTEADEVALARYDACVTFDMAAGRSWITAAGPEAAEALEEALRRPEAPAPEDAPLALGPPVSPVSRAQYAALVDGVKELIAAGDVYQVNLSHRFEATLAPDVAAAAVYLRLRRSYAAPYGAFFDAGPVQVVSNSPEGFLRVDLAPGRRRVETWPLKGTRPRAADPGELRADPKERAEHVMIVDLERNDLGRVAVPGSVRVPALLEVVAYPTLYHLESRVEAEPLPGLDLLDILRATFPGGSITGAPKIRAMEIIADLEGTRRGVYCGALGYVGFGGQQSHWSIPIRTAVVQGRMLELRVGGGIVADSDGEREYEETLTKARAFLELLSSAPAGPGSRACAGAPGSRPPRQILGDPEPGTP